MDAKTSLEDGCWEVNDLTMKLSLCETAHLPEVLIDHNHYTFRFPLNVRDDQ